MNKTVELRNGQSLFDIALMQMGSVEAAWAIAFANGMTVTDVGSSVEVEQVNDRLADWLIKNNSTMATGGDVSEPTLLGTGTSTRIAIEYSAPERGYNVRDGQSLFDIAIQKLGSVEKAFDLAILNNITVTDKLASWQLINTDLDVDNVPLVEYFVKQGVIPATGKMPIVDNVEQELAGIGYWAIELDFEVQ